MQTKQLDFVCMACVCAHVHAQKCFVGREETPFCVPLQLTLIDLSNKHSLTFAVFHLVRTHMFQQNVCWLQTLVLVHFVEFNTRGQQCFLVVFVCKCMHA